MTIKLQLLFKDRVGIVADVSRLIAENSLNITSMEVDRTADEAEVYLEIENAENTSIRDRVFEIMGGVPGLVEVKFIVTLPHEDREKRFRVVLDNISDGVISIDSEGKITTINAVARKIFDCEDEEVIGRPLTGIKLPDYKLLDCLEGGQFNNVKKNYIGEKGRYQFISTGKPIIESTGLIIGAVEICRNMQEIKMLAKSISQPDRVTFSDFMGKNRIIESAIVFAQKIAGTDSVVSIRGESGTGKELFARSIHEESGRKDGPFIPVNCAALPESLLESELFGYAEGAFTGASKKGKPGLFETAQGGTIFLDEIAEMPLGAQAKILRIIQEKRNRRVGSASEIEIDARVITATNRNLEDLVKKNMFREDLYYRINVLPIHIPPLKERLDDIPELAEHFLFLFASRQNKTIQSISPEAMEKLLQHHWPGNVRELKNVIERAAIFCEEEQILPEHLFFSFDLDKKIDKTNKIPDSSTNKLYDAIYQYEKNIIERAMENSESIRKTARELGISHTTLLNKLKKYKL